MNIQKFLFVLLLLNSFLIAQSQLAHHKQIKISSLHSWYMRAGAEVEVGRRHLIPDQQDGLRWPAQFKWQDTECAKSIWIGATNYDDPIAGTTFDHKVVHFGPRVENEISEFMPVKFKMIGKRAYPLVFVNGVPASELLAEDVLLDEVNPNIPGDIMIINEVNTGIGVTMKRKIHAFSDKNHDNYFIYDYTFVNSGIVDPQGTVNIQTLDSMMIFFMYRYGPTREACSYGYDWMPQSATWGHATMNDVMFTHPISGDPFRAEISWLGKHSGWSGPGDNIGAPNYLGDGRLGAAQFVGTVVLHADKSAGNPIDDPNQPTTTHYVGSDEPWTYNNDPFNAAKMDEEYSVITAGHPAQTHAQAVGDGYADLYGHTPGGFSQGQGFGPYTLAHADSIRIVLAEAVAGIDRQSCYDIGYQWLYGSAPFTKPDGSTTSDPNEYKNAWVMTGYDSLIQTFENAQDNFNMNLQLPDPPPPPEVFTVYSDSNKINLEWGQTPSTWPAFAGYRIYRSVSKPDTFFNMIFECGSGTGNPVVNTFADYNVNYGFEYYYYITTFDNSGNESSLFYTRTNIPVYLTNDPLIYHDIFVDPAGDDTNSGQSPDQPFKTINRALEKIGSNFLSPYTIHIAPGVYSPSANSEIFPLTCKSYINIHGSGMDSTIIDADSSATVFSILNNDSVLFSDMTIMNGKSVQYPHGGGLSVDGSSIRLKNLNIQFNNAGTGGGIAAINNSKVFLENVTIKHNFAISGGGIFKESGSHFDFSRISRCNIYMNEADNYGDDIYVSGSYILSGSELPLEVVVDTFTVFSPTPYHVWPINEYIFNIQHDMIPQINADVYVNPAGDDNNSGISAVNPFKTIEHAVKMLYTDSVTHHNIYLAAGIYGPQANNERLPVLPGNNSSIIGDNVQTTMIDGAQENQIFRVRAVNNSVLENLKIINGNGTFSGGAIYLNDAQISLKNLIITNNYAAYGGGIYCTRRPWFESKLNMSNVSIHNNTAQTAGGIYFNGVDSNSVQFDDIQRCNIYNNNATSDGKDLYLISGDILKVYLDTCTIRLPDSEFTYPADKFILDVNHSIIPQANANLYVSPNGNDDNNGLSSLTPFKTINHAMRVIWADSLHRNSIFLDEGVYSESATGDSMPITGKNYVTVTGADDSLSYIDGENQNRVFELTNLRVFNLQDLSVINGYAEDGGGIYCNNTALILERVSVNNNFAEDEGAGIFIENSEVLLYLNIFSEDSAADKGGAIYNKNSKVFIYNTLIKNNQAKYGAGIYTYNYTTGLRGRNHIVNSTIADNSASTSTGGCYFRGEQDVYILNSILWNNTDQLNFVGKNEQNLFLIDYSDIESGENGINFLRGTFHYLANNIDKDPLFTGGNPFDYHLTQHSPCIDKGTELFVWEGDTIVLVPDTMYEGLAPDMGVFESPFTADIHDQDHIPLSYKLYQNYPNPFNPKTTIRYDIPQRNHVNLTIYDLLGRTVRTLVNEYQQSGRYAVQWDSKNLFNNKAASGIYIYKLKAGDFVQTRKLVLLK